MNSFYELGLLPTLQATLDAQRITRPTEIQARAMPELLAGRSVVGVAETGSGKTLAYALPILHKIKSLEESGSPVTAESAPRAVVLVPSRELGEQVARVFKTFTHDTRLRVRMALGGVDLLKSRENVKGAFEVLVATPGRLGQLVERKIVSLGDVRMMVLDEADQLLDLGFLPQAGDLVNATPAGRQLALFTATLPPPVARLAQRTFNMPVELRSRGSHRPVSTLHTINRRIVDGRRFEQLQIELATPNEGGTLLFTNTREQCDKVVYQLARIKRPCAVFRGEMDRVERRVNLKRFRDGEVDLLIATDLGARGLDIEHVGRVINYNLPSRVDNYLHRAGRTARAGRTGVVINFVSERDQALIKELERLG